MSQTSKIEKLKLSVCADLPKPNVIPLQLNVDFYAESEPFEDVTKFQSLVGNRIT